MPERILIIVPGFPASENDTTCLPAVQNYVRALARLHPQVDVQVIALHYPFQRTRYDWHGVRVSAVGGANRAGLQKLRLWQRAWRQIHGASADLVHSFWVGECTLLGAAAARRIPASHVASIGGRELLEPTAYSWLLRAFDFTLVAGSNHAAETSRRTLGRTVDAVIPLGLDVEHFQHAARERTVDVLFVGSLIESKRPRELLSAARALPTARFVVVGDGPQRSALEHAAPPNVAFTGHVERPKVIDLMQDSKVLLHPSEFESQGYVFLEALASGMHVVCRDVGAPGASANVHRRNTKSEMTQTVAQLLERLNAFPPVPVPTAEETVHAYMEVYRRPRH